MDDGMMKRFSLEAYFGIRVRSSKGATVSYYYPFWRFSYILPFAFFHCHFASYSLLPFFMACWYDDGPPVYSLLHILIFSFSQRSVR